MSDLLETLPPAVRTLELPPSALALTAVGRSGGLIEGERVAVRLEPGRARVDFSSGPTVEVDERSLGALANSVLTPGMSRRERVGPTGTTTGTILVAPTLPLVWIQWRPAPGAGLPPIGIRVAGAWARSGRPAPGAVVLRSPASASEEPLLAAWVTGPAALGHREGGDLVVEAVRTDAVPAGGGPDGVEPVTLVLACGDERALRAATAAAAHWKGHARRAASEDEDGLRFRTGVPEIDEGVAWARRRLAGLLHGPTGERDTAVRDAPPRFEPSRRLWVGLAALAVGDAPAARVARAALPEASAEGAVLAGRIAAVTGDAGPATTAARALLDRAEGEHPGTAPDPGLLAVALSMLADGLRYASPDAEIAELRRLAGAFATRSRAPSVADGRLPVVGGARRLPMTEGTPSAGAWLASLMAGAPHRPSNATRGDAGSLRDAAAAFVTKPDLAWAAWRSALTRGLEGGPAGPGSWDAPGSSGEALTAELLLTAAHGLLGTAPDAPVGRLGLSPRLPAHLQRFAADGIVLGDARLALEYRKEGPAHAWELRPLVAAVPPLVVFEPTVSGRVTSVRIDGAEADLETRAGEGRTVVPVQLPVDGVRYVEILTEPG